ncbi:D-alanyl-D-alanine carboxypeptidase [Schinkia azotoformans]|uniref:serine-type D-Ala-D-Ala carboxypeptidase n=1 Tax=Schinkia azotoformans LMG 9581 TaxID=1131731 RepID=K6CS63_SCHAZ|nr:D-alanyl-D-alanine carboxypeptidase family protein [Schinkia azotoformans]EKN63077.1 serine-type D-Ala-D-Ala carboxypeptidase [Schinkia azotoformans LMG 9581]MEC1640438.1 D-alanyl-D-alanine carboxypeptidase [Schinkia azotoformans]MEC1723048.1 D-alanyl-D-alanine carboxypeptidase [Schinkia azotoformans]MEC1944677.1 D-alanyl-D-alanine carboxypeptidase [Schinkia azotoformans]MED4352720.1 D-alanyl-D-alanine carboxypeptidase [Schinkia azotoformans]
MSCFKKVIFLHIVIILSFSIFIPYKAAAFSNVSAETAILMDFESGRVLYEKAAHKKMRIASITKIMTAILAIESGKLDETVKVSDRAVRTEGSSVYLKPGEKIKLEHLVYGLMLRSGNDSAVAIAEHVGGSVEGFVYLMNQKAQEIGMRDTVFSNPHGLDDHENHFSTAYDMAILTKYAMENETYREISGTKVHKAPNPDEKWDRSWKNKNKLLTGLYEYSTGGKTGFTKRAKRTLVSTAEKDGHDLIAVTLNGPNDWNDHISMFEWGFAQYDLENVVKKGVVHSVKDDFYKGKVVVRRDFLYPVTDEEKDNLKVEVKLIKPDSNWKKVNDIPAPCGIMIIKLDNKNIGEIPLYYDKRGKVSQKTWFSNLKEMFLSMIGVHSHG